MDEKRKYLIGDIARIAGVTRDTLRFYEKKGIIEAKKDNNGYRYYSDNDIYNLVHILYHRKMNSSLKDIEEIRRMDRGSTLDFMKDYLKTSIKREEEALKSHRRTIARLLLTKRDMKNAETYMGKYLLKRFPEAYIIDECSNFREGLRNWFQVSAMKEGLDMTYFYTELEFGEKEIEVKATRLLLYKELEKKLDMRKELQDFPETDQIKCIYTVTESEKILPDIEMMEQMADWGRKKGLEPDSKAYVNNMLSFSWEDSPRYCLELYLPVRE